MQTIQFQWKDDTTVMKTLQAISRTTGPTNIHVGTDVNFFHFYQNTNVVIYFVVNVAYCAKLKLHVDKVLIY